MKKSILYSAITVNAIVSAVPMTASAAVTALNVDSAMTQCDIRGLPSDCVIYGLYAGSDIFSGSWFSMDYNDNGITEPIEKIAITSTGIIDFANTTPAAGSHAGAINGSETPVFDIWEFFGGTGMDYLTSPLVDNEDGTIDMSGWTVTWNGIAAIPMGGDANQGDTSLATISCGATCVDNQEFTLDYSAHVPLGDFSGFGGVGYCLHLEGTIASVSSVPIPASVWLFGSGLIGLIGVAKRKKV